MAILQLDNLVKTGALNSEPVDRQELDGLVRSAVDRLHDAANPTLSLASRLTA